MPAKAGIQDAAWSRPYLEITDYWVPAFAGTTGGD